MISVRSYEMSVRDEHNCHKIHSYKVIYNIENNKIVTCLYLQTKGGIQEYFENIFNWREFDAKDPIYPKYFQEALKLINSQAKNPISVAI